MLTKDPDEGQTQKDLYLDKVWETQASFTSELCLSCSLECSLRLKPASLRRPVRGTPVAPGALQNHWWPCLAIWLARTWKF